MRVIPIEQLKPGLEIATDIVDEDAIVLLSQGNLLSSSQIHKIRSSNIAHVYITDEYCGNNELTYTADATQMVKKMKKIRNAVNNAASGTSTNTAITQGLGVVKGIVDELDAQKYTLKISFEPMKIMSDELYEKNMYIAMMSTLLALKLGFDKSYASKVCLGALLMDIAIMSPTFDGEITTRDKTHPIIGHEYMSQKYNFPIEVMEIILQHHEMYDGKGYPNGLAGELICAGARLVSIIEVFYLIQTSYMKQADFTNIEKDYNNWLSHLDPKFVKVFLNNVTIYPIDTLVILNNGDIGVVIPAQDDNPYALLRAKFARGDKNKIEATPFSPTIKIIKSAKVEVGTVIDLSKTPSLDIYKVIYHVD